MKVAILMIDLAIIQLMAEPSQALTCGQVDAALSPCIAYLTHGDQSPDRCCVGVRSIKEWVANSADERTACNCVKHAAIGFAGLSNDAAKSLLNKCGVQLDIPVFRNTNCDVCGQVDAALSLCVIYLTQGGTPMGKCCAMVRNIKEWDANAADKRAVCNCMKNAAIGVSGLNER